MVQHDESTKKWVSLGPRGLNPYEISYKPEINSSMVQGEKNRERARIEGSKERDGNMGKYR